MSTEVTIEVAAMEQYIRGIAEQVFHGELPAERAYAELYRLSATLEDAMKSVKEDAILAVRKYGKEGFAADGMKVTVRSAPGRWDYSGVTSIASMKERLKVLEQIAKAAYEAGAPLADAVTSELIEPAVFTPGADTLSVSLK